MKISILGNPCSGKTTLARKLAARYHWPVYHIDSLQFDENKNLIDPRLTAETVLHICLSQEWIIEGHGPLKIIEERLKKSDLIVIIRRPLIMNVLFFLKRHFDLLFKRRSEMPSTLNELQWSHIAKLWKTLHSTEKGLWTQLLPRLEHSDYQKNTIFYVKNNNDIKKLIYFIDSRHK